MKNKKYSNLEALTIIVAAWNIGMADANAICAKSDTNISQGMLELMSFISGKEVTLNEAMLSDSQYANDAIEYYNTFIKLSKLVNYTKWKSLKRKPLVRTYGAVFDLYLSRGFNLDILNHLPFFKMTKRQFAKLFIKMRNDL